MALDETPMPLGKLYVCPTPIGNLKDITLRVLEVLREVDLVAAEDTRRTSILLRHYGISAKAVSYHEHNEERKGPELLARMKKGATIALVSNAGMPGLSDPGYRLVRAVLDEDLPLEVLPGPSVLLTALVGSGLPPSQFVFGGFLPRKRKARRDALLSLDVSGKTMVLFESARRLKALLEDVRDCLGDRRVSVGRELTKLFEETVRGRVDEVLERFGDTVKGEVVVVIGGPEGRGRASGGIEDARVTPQEIASEVEALTGAGASRRDAVTEVAAKYGRPKKEIYRIAHEGKNA